MAYEVLLEKDDRILRLGWGNTKEEAEKKMLNYISNTEKLGESMEFRIWIEED